MSWSDNLLPCSWRGTVFEIQRTQDSADRATAEHTYPYVDGADVDDLGRGPRLSNIDAIFYGSDYDQRLQAFIKQLDVGGTGELVHPVFGSMPKMQLLRYTITHDADHVDSCTVSLEFKESTPSTPFFDRSLASQKVDAVSQQGDTARGALADGLASTIDSIRNSNVLATLNNLRTSMFGPLQAGLSNVQGVLLSGLDVLNYPRAWASDLSSIVDGVLNLHDFSDNLMSDWSASSKVFSTFDVFSSGGGVSASAPYVPQILPSSAPTETQAVAVVAAHVATEQAIGTANATALVLSAEADPTHGPTLSPPDIEAITDASRSQIDNAITAIRAIYPLETARTITEPLKDQALALQTAAQAIIEARPPLIEQTVPTAGNYRLLAHLLYGDHTRAPELARLNPAIGLPNNLQAGDVINAYSN